MNVICRNVCAAAALLIIILNGTIVLTNYALLFSLQQVEYAFKVLLNIMP